VAGVSVLVSSISGWYDIFLPGQLRDFRILLPSRDTYVHGPTVSLARCPASLEAIRRFMTEIRSAPTADSSTSRPVRKMAAWVVERRHSID
jgi:hypothetical protein